MNFSMRGSVKTVEDNEALDNLINYCMERSVNLSIQQIGQQLVISFNGEEDSLQELYDYLAQRLESET